MTIDPRPCDSFCLAENVTGLGTRLLTIHKRRNGNRITNKKTVPLYTFIFWPVPMNLDPRPCDSFSLAEYVSGLGTRLLKIIHVT